MERAKKAVTKKSLPSPGLAPKEDSRASSVQSVVRACAILKCFRSNAEVLQLDEIATRCGLPKPTAYRLLATLVECGMLQRPERNRYRLPGSSPRRVRYRFGYAAQSDISSFARIVSDSIRSSAYSAGIDLIVLDNHLSAKIALRNVNAFVHERVDFVIEFQTVEKAATAISARLRLAGIPCLAIEVPHPQAFYFGANNYRAGVMGGRALGQACLDQWRGQADQVLLLEQLAAGALPQARLTGTIAGLREVLPKFSEQNVEFLEGHGRFASSWEAARRYLARSRAQRVLISGVNDEGCRGALAAFSEAGRAEHCIVVGQNASMEVRQDMRQPGSRFVGSVGYFPEQYGDAVVSLAIRVLEGDPPPPSTFVKHQLVTPENVDKLYPHDALSAKQGGDSILYSGR
ncbi:substrate-binding domain-containing protein [Granulicella sibirica]|uniref:Putative sugar uptake ABC transporter periplasmic solute-binding protein n=1 Tax=Granulicella sibirica TaxID=2479048 RepID=A0A4Q0SUK1_9BACT|nr:substrate-binding domain-containing protein [Granulicella sibirica]RXH54723.1 putative sugar uptake ABC transporter periplasmic solute-binding protein precursor [Granulicella sibirica]